MRDEREEVTGRYVSLEGQTYYQIANSHRMPDFFMSIVGASDHWMFVSSSGALTAGRRDPDSALFPYAADDQIVAARATTGPTTSIWIEGRCETFWQPFVEQAGNDVRRNLYKTPLGNAVLFEEIHEPSGLAFRYRWAFSERFGFVRSCTLENQGSAPCTVDLLDGLRNVLPYGVGSEFMLRFSNLANAYKKSELLEASGLALFYMSSIPTDRAEPSEGLKATTVWQTGLTPRAILLSADGIEAFRRRETLDTECDVRGTPGAYLLNQRSTLEPGARLAWHVVAELEQDHVDVVDLDAWLRTTQDPAAAIAADVEVGTREFLGIMASADGLQCSANARRAHRHLSNTVFNVMRGGVPLASQGVDVDDFRRHVANANQGVFDRHRAWLEDVSPPSSSAAWIARIDELGDPDLTRLALEYLPLAFSRRHGDPTRPWNRFSINLRAEDGNTILDYQGNWRDIFQNWEALAHAFPRLTTSMICRFVNATTADGYNPYRVTKAGFEWEEPSPEDPWANIGYWGDHQIVYLLELLEWDRRVSAFELDELLNRPIFVHANVPYRIRNFEAIQNDPRATIEFDHAASRAMAQLVAEVGADGKLLRDAAGTIHRVTLLEKLLTLTLAKLSNFVPDGGIWLNTQRPEWNDANNALVGHGLSMVTTCYLHRWLRFLHGWLCDRDEASYPVSVEVVAFLRAIHHTLSDALPVPGKARTHAQRLRVVEALSRAGSDYRNTLYEHGVSGRTEDLAHEECATFFETARRHLEATIRGNRRTDGLYHAYNLLDWQEGGIAIEHLVEMLEGQVAVLGSGLLSGADAVALLDALRSSALYREDQDSYLLYPNRRLPRFLEKNLVPAAKVAASPLLTQLLEDGDERIVRRDVRGGVHFSGRFRNANDVRSALDQLPTRYRSLLELERHSLADLFEELFAHRQFTGRSGTFFAYEGLGSIYWHMVSKLSLAVVDAFFGAIDRGEDATVIAALREHFQAIRRGIGAEKSPSRYGAFPSDPYSHTPENAGVKQPGMTGQVKEDILSRFAEVGIHVEEGRLRFRFELFDRAELLTEPQDFTYRDVTGAFQVLRVPAGGFAFTFCQVPIILQAGASNRVVVSRAGVEPSVIEGLELDVTTSQALFARGGTITRVDCHFVPVSQ
ncbi:MAG: hypothetical protein H6834_05425 [Planctomycetes bacterium]|nr:hypothetical protein [Planctomycetota bacterium]